MNALITSKADNIFAFFNLSKESKTFAAIVGHFIGVCVTVLNSRARNQVNVDAALCASQRAHPRLLQLSLNFDNTVFELVIIWVMEDDGSLLEQAEKHVFK